MNTKKTAGKIPQSPAENSGFCLQQALIWAQKCYAIGALEVHAADPEAAANVRKMLASGAGRIEARLDLSSHSCSFILCLDQGGEGAREMQLFSHFFEPTAPSTTSKH